MAMPRIESNSGMCERSSRAGSRTELLTLAEAEAIELLDPDSAKPWVGAAKFTFIQNSFLV